jgi:hypothetical protein
MKMLLIINLLLINVSFFSCFAQSSKVEKDIITFYFKNKEKKSYVDIVTENEDLTRHELLEDWKEVGFWVIKINYYEDIKYFLVSQEDGKEIEMSGKLLLSDNKIHFACFSGELEEPLYKNFNFEVWKFQNNDVQLVDSGSFENQYIQDFSWEEDELVLYLVSSEDESTEEFRWKNSKKK